MTKKLIVIACAAILVLALSLTVVISEILATNTPKTDLTRIACLGDSITEICGYPEYLQELLGNGSVVGNFGVSASAVNFWSDKPYYFEPTYRSARNFSATTVIVMLGTNDARYGMDDKIVNFTANYERLLNRTQHWNSTKQVYVVIPPPIFDNSLDLNGTFYAQEVIPRIKQVAKDMGLPVIDVYTPMLKHPEYFSVDGVHPDCEGAQAIAKIIYNYIKTH
ncbi:MAG: GDSL-type esterase/lipase family protein [Candidatus Bathyarchaeota archaeon]|nr:GDSL-type esterase/lipase family protein [Candidatus Bathyarchaeota archaeon]